MGPGLLTPVLQESRPDCAGQLDASMGLRIFSSVIRRNGSDGGRMESASMEPRFLTSVR